MGKASDFKPERLVIALLASEGCEVSTLTPALEVQFGAIDFQVEGPPFSWTDYYEPEMGLSLRRFFISFERLVDPGELAMIKLFCNRLELDTARDGRRVFNLDPGLLSPGRFILATTKDRAHRIPLGMGIYAELTLHYEKGAFRSLPWTYPDWRSEAYRTLLAALRKRLKISG